MEQPYVIACHPSTRVRTPQATAGCFAFTLRLTQQLCRPNEAVVVVQAATAKAGGGAGNYFKLALDRQYSARYLPILQTI